MCLGASGSVLHYRVLAVGPAGWEGSSMFVGFFETKLQKYVDFFIIRRLNVEHQMK